MANRRFIDFPIASSVGDSDIVLIWQDGMNKQTTKGTLIQGAPTSLEGLTDVDIAGLINGQILQYNSTTGKWENVDRTDINLSELGDVSIVSPANGQVLVYNSSTSKWENSSGGYVPYTGAVTTVNLGAQSILAGSFVRAGGTSAQFLKADGSVDSSTYGTGTVTSVALTMPTAFSVANSPVTTTGTLAVTATGTTSQYIRGDGSLETFPALTGFVPYTGATADVNLGTHDLAAERGTFANNGSSDTLTVNHTSGSGYGIIVTKGGNNEALYVSKTSGSGNAMTVVGGRTSLVDLALSSVTNTAGDFLTISGGVVHKRTAAQTLTDIGGQAALTNPVTGTGTTNYLPKFTGSTTIGNSIVSEISGNINIGTTASTTYGTLLVVQNSVSAPNFVRGLQIVHPNGTGSTGGYISMSNIGQKLGAIQVGDDGAVGSLVINPVGGNLGLGVTPSAWNLLKPIEIGNAGNFFAGFQGGSAVYIGNAAYYSSGWKYATTGDGAGLIDVGAGAFTFSNAASGTAGNSLTWTPRLNITSGGNLLVGTTTDNGARLQVNGFSRFDRGTLAFTLNPSYAGGNVYSQLQSTGDLSLATGGDNNRVYINSSGNVGIATSSPSAPLHVVNSSNGFIYRFAGGTSSAITGGIFAEVGRNFASIGTISNHAFNIFTNDADRFSISTNGNCTIGNSPIDAGFKLDVYGTGRFSGVVQINTNTTGLILNRGAVTNFTGIGYLTNAVGQWFVGMRENLSSNNYIIYNENGTDALTISKSNSAATFSSSVTASNLRASATNTIGWTNQGGFESISDGNFKLYNEARTVYGNLTLGKLLIGTETSGASKLRIIGLPTSAAGLSSGDVYNLAGVLMIA